MCFCIDWILICPGWLSGFEVLRIRRSRSFASKIEVAQMFMIWVGVLQIGSQTSFVPQHWVLCPGSTSFAVLRRRGCCKLGFIGHEQLTKSLGISQKNTSEKHTLSHNISPNITAAGAGQVFLLRHVLRTFQIRQMLGSKVEVSGSFTYVQWFSLDNVDGNIKKGCAVPINFQSNHKLQGRVAF